MFIFLLFSDSVEAISNYKCTNLRHSANISFNFISLILFCLCVVDMCKLYNNGMNHYSDLKYGYIWINGIRKLKIETCHSTSFIYTYMLHESARQIITRISVFSVHNVQNHQKIFFFAFSLRQHFMIIAVAPNEMKIHISFSKCLVFTI